MAKGLAVTEKDWTGMPKGFWGYQIDDPGPPPLGWTQKDWQQFSPGMRREIKRDIQRQRKLKFSPPDLK